MRAQVFIIALLTGLLFIKVGSFHVYAHEKADNPIETCGYCDLAVENQQAELSPPLFAAQVPAPIPELIEIQVKLPRVAAVSSHLTSYILTRPPPALG